MRRTRLMHPVLAIAMVAAIGCNRAETRDQTARAASEIKTAAARAGDSLADGLLTTRIQAQYFADEQVKGRYIGVSTSDKVVTLKGFVESPAARERALQIARGTTGVKQVNDQLLIGQSPAAFEEAQRPVATAGEGQPVPAAASAAATDDAQLTSNIQAKYFLDSTVKARHIEVDTRGGVVTINGEVGSEGERAQALLIARDTPGVQRVEDHLSVNLSDDQSRGDAAATASAALDDATLTSHVKARLGADPQFTAIVVTATNGVVQLQGTVPTAAARQRALDLVRENEGATQVIDRLKVRR
jgi:hyperosmotically inducible periplasmic protein